MFSNHFFNWTSQLKGSGHEVYWLDVLDSNTKVEKIDFVEQTIGWRFRWDFPGRYFLKKNAPFINNLFNIINERKLEKVFENLLEEIKPDLVHSFTMHLSCIPLLKVMNRNPQKKWVFSSWGSDLFYYKDQPEVMPKMREVLARVDYMFSDCKRDFNIANDLNFKGEFLGVFPGGGGFDFENFNPFINDFSLRRLMLIKGYEGKHGRCNNVLESLRGLQKELSDTEIVIFGADHEVREYVAKTELKTWKNLSVLGEISHFELMKRMGEARIYIGNSLSDGMPNTLLEAIVIGAFPVQSNPGGATAEIISNGKNGLLIDNPDNIVEIREKLKFLLQAESSIIKQGVEYNFKNIKPSLERSIIKQKVLIAYNSIEKHL